MLVSFTWSLEFWPIEARRQSSNGATSWTIRFATSNLLVGVSSNESPSNLRWNWKCYNSVATANFDQNGKMQPTAECHGLQLKHSGAHKVLLLSLFDLQHRFEAAEFIGIAKLFFPKPQQHWNQSTSLVHSPPPTPLKVALGIAGLATHGRNKLVQGASADPTLSFVPFSQSPTLDDQLSRFAKLLQQNQTLSLVPPRQAKLCAKACDEQRRQIHRKQKWSMEFCCSCFRVQMHNPLVRGSPHASMYHQGTEASLLELRKLMTLGGLGVRDSPNTTGWPPLVFQGLAPMDQWPKSWTTNNRQAKYRTPQMPSAFSHWFSNGSRSRSRKTSQCVQVMFKANKHVYKKHHISKFDHGWVRKKTHQN